MRSRRQTGRWRASTPGWSRPRSRSAPSRALQRAQSQLTLCLPQLEQAREALAAEQAQQGRAEELTAAAAAIQAQLPQYARLDELRRAHSGLLTQMEAQREQLEQHSGELNSIQAGLDELGTRQEALKDCGEQLARLEAEQADLTCGGNRP